MMTASELAPLLENWHPWDAVGVLGGLPVLSVVLDDPAAADRVAQASRSIPVIIVGVHLAGTSLYAAELDILLTEQPTAPRPWVRCESTDDEAARIETCIHANPRAAVSLVQLMRGFQPGNTTAALLAAESWIYGTLQAGQEFAAWLQRRPEMTVHTATGSEVETERENDCLTISLNRPSRRNAYNAAMRDGLLHALVPAVRDSATKVRLRGTGSNFCSGGDLSEFGTTRDSGYAHLIRTTASPAWWIDRAADRIDVRLHGACIGAGIELAAFAGQVTAEPNAFFRLPEIEMGLVPGAGGTVSITRRIGAQRMAWMAITGTPIDAARGLSWGLVDRLA